MTDPSVNPYRPSDSHPLGPTARLRDTRVPLLIWLAVAVIAAIGVPADPISEALAWAFGLISFGVGALLGSALHLGIRTIPAFLWSAAIVYLALTSTWGVLFCVAALIYLALSVGLGCWMSQIRRRHLQAKNLSNEPQVKLDK